MATFIGYQVHERTNGSGYPRRRSAMTIHRFAKIVAIADVFSAMTRPRPYRPAILPHEAVKQILVDGSHNKLDRTLLRAFLDCVSAFPIGSVVELNNGLKGNVLRATPGLHTRPVIEELDVQERQTGNIIDLSDETHLTVIRAHHRSANRDAPVLVSS